jgi:hypothetical protein
MKGKSKCQTYNKEFAEVVLMLKPPGPLADLANAIAFLADKVWLREL